MAITILPVNKQFSNAVHLADIHILLTKRHEEYKIVFNRLYDSIAKTPENTAIFVLGDLVNSKLDLSPECVDLAAEFLVELADLRPTILITGNHDTNLSNRNRLDSLSPIVDAINHPNLFYLKTSGLYAFGNICINNYSVFDDTDKYMKGKDIPAIYRNKYEHFIATYHGIVHGAKTDLGFVLSNPSVTIDMFDHHDLVLLGDVHLSQDLQVYDDITNKPYIRYCGSLIQQKHDEPLKGHGYTFWGLENREYEHVEIPNDYGFFTVIMEDGIVKNNTSTLPKKTHLKIKKKNTKDSEIQTAIIELKEWTEIIEPVIIEKEKSDVVLAKIPSLSGNVSLGKIDDTSYQAKIITDYLKTKLKISDQDFIDDVIKINNDMNNRIVNDDFAKNIRWTPIRFEWSNMFSYGEDNVVDFTKAKDIIGIFAANRSGKSSIFSALTFCMFDKCDRDFKAAHIMHTSATTFTCKFEFEVDGKRFYIKRDAEADKKGKVKVDVEFWKIENGQKIDLNGEQRADTNSIIRQYLGTYDDFVLTSLSVQNGKNTASIIDMGDTDRKDLFAQFMGLNVFDKLYTEANERLKEQLVILKTYRNENYSQKLEELSNLLSQAKLVYDAQKETIDTTEQHRKLIQENVVNVTKQLIPLDVKIPSLTDSEQALRASKNQLEIVKEDVEKSESRLTTLCEQLDTIEKEVTELESKNITETYNQYQLLLIKKQRLENKREQLKESYNHYLKIYEKSKSLDYDPNCSFCVKHAGIIAQEASDAAVRLERIQADALSLKTEVDEVEKSIDELKWVVEVQATWATRVKVRNDFKDKKLNLTHTLNTYKNKLPQIEESIKTHERNIELYNKNKESMQSNELVNKKIDELNKELSQIDYTLKTKNKSLMDISGKISICQNQINVITDKIEKVKEAEKKYKLLDIYCNAVCRDGIPFEIITATVPEIQTEVNNILAQITDFTAVFETDGKNIIPYISLNNKKWLMNLTSGFEKFALSLAIRVALINISNLPRPNFLVLDEGFGVLDAENLASAYALLTYLKSNFSFIIVISHLDALRDFVDNHIEITKDNGLSKVNFV